MGKSQGRRIDFAQPRNSRGYGRKEQKRKKSQRMVVRKSPQSPQSPQRRRDPMLECCVMRR